jgi:hypothetical protein
MGYGPNVDQDATGLVDGSAIPRRRGRTTSVVVESAPPDTRAAIQGSQDRNREASAPGERSGPWATMAGEVPVVPTKASG